jgi:anthranilate phosphoribosyltransferase
MGVFAADLVPFIATVLGELGTESAMVVNGYGGLDELTVTGPNQVAHYTNGHIDRYELDPTDYGFPAASIKDLQGGERETNAAILRGVLDGTITDAKRDVVLLNAGAALVAAGAAAEIAEGIEQARTTIDSGAAAGKLNALVAYSKELAL